LSAAMTLRQRLIDLLEHDAFTIRDLSNILGLREREILDHLPHIARSIAPDKKIQLTAPQCQECGFEFRKRTRYSTPSKCPKCRSHRIKDPLLTIQSKD
jgi:predicted Zn-ribbon and HTH transcriptional regulator